MASPNSFSALKDLPEPLITNLTRLGYTSMTPIQAQTLPLALSGKDVIAQAKTGSGKTAAFGIPLLESLKPRFFGVQSLVLCPTRELSTQVAEELRKLARYQPNIKIVVLCGGVSIGPQISSLAHGAHVVVGTPGRIKDHLRKQTLDIAQVSTLVLDEADRMLDMGFSEDIQHIVGHIPTRRQTLLFSATYPDDINALSENLQRNPQAVKVESVHSFDTITQQHIMCNSHERLSVLMKVMLSFKIEHAIIFCNTKQFVETVAEALKAEGYTALALHGDMEQRDRDQIYNRFKQRSAHCLVATDVAARGLDVEQLQAVINYELPRDPEVYVHRIGRTGRAGKTGFAINLVGSGDDAKRHEVNRVVGQDIAMKGSDELSPAPFQLPAPPYVTLSFAEGRKNKLRPGDIVGAITASKEVPGDAIGNIAVLDFVAYVAVERSQAKKALQLLLSGRIKGRKIKVRWCE